MPKYLEVSRDFEELLPKAVPQMTEHSSIHLIVGASTACEVTDKHKASYRKTLELHNSPNTNSVADGTMYRHPS